MTTKDSKKVGSSCGPNRESRTAPPSASRPPLARGCNSPLNTHLYTTGIEAGPPGYGTVPVTCIKLLYVRTKLSYEKFCAWCRMMICKGFFFYL